MCSVWMCVVGVLVGVFALAFLWLVFILAGLRVGCAWLVDGSSFLWVCWLVVWRVLLGVRIFLELVMLHSFLWRV